MTAIASRVPRPVRKSAEADLMRLVEQSTTPLVRGRNILCPACERWHDVLQYTPLQYSSKYALQVIVPLKCCERDCGHVFALHPAPNRLEDNAA